MQPTTYQTVAVDGLNIFYRDAGPKDAPALLLLHGFPSSSRMYEPLLTRLADTYRLIAPDYPGFGHSDAPAANAFAYTFDRIADVMTHFCDAIGLSRTTLFMQDYGGPVGFRMALAKPERVAAMIVQNAVAHDVGLGPLWAARRAFWADRAGNEEKLRANFFSFEATRQRHLGKSPHPEGYDPDLWTDEYRFLTQAAQGQIQLDLFYDYRANVAAYPRWQAWLRDKKPKLLVLWGIYDPSFETAEAEAYRADVPDAEVHLLEAGHFAMDEAADEVAALTRDFLKRAVGT